MILVAEDERSSRKALRNFLEKLGCIVTVVQDGQQAIDAVVQNSYDLIILDMRMPHTDGYEAAATIRKKGIEIPIIAFTANKRYDDKAKCLEAGCTEYLSKPTHPEELRDMLAQFCPVLRIDS